jgi:hypothetical protein
VPGGGVPHHPLLQERVVAGGQCVTVAQHDLVLAGMALGACRLDTEAGLRIEHEVIFLDAEGK